MHQPRMTLAWVIRARSLPETSYLMDLRIIVSVALHESEQFGDLPKS